MRISLTLTMGILACVTGCGGSGGGGGGPPPPPSALSYPAVPALYLNQAITLTPTVSGAVSSYTVSPALPTGLSLNSVTGVISGAPTSATAYATYVVTASNASGSTKESVSFEVLASLYSSSYYSFTVGVGATVMPAPAAVEPTHDWSVAPPLPAGLSVNPHNGYITGTPTAVSAPANYVVSLKTAGATFTATLTLAVAAPLLDLGHVSGLSFARFSGSSLLTQAGSGHWILWNYTTGETLASGVSRQPPPATVDLEGSTVVIQTSAALEVRAAADGHVLSEIATTPSWWQLASDGSYLCAGSASGLTAWSPAGTVFFTRSGDYSKALAFAAPNEIQLALGPAGANVIETLTVPSGTSTTGPTFSGQFQSWFLDGGRYFTALNNTVWVYSNASVQQDLATLPTQTQGQPTGQGNWYWTGTGSGLTLYAVGSKGTATNTYPVAGGVFPSPTTGSVVFVLGGNTAASGQLTRLDLSGVAPSTTTLTTPFGITFYGLTAYAASSNTIWIVGDGAGVLFDGASSIAHPRYLNYGLVTSIAGSTANAVIATASGRILVFDAATLALQSTIDQWAWQLAESADGTVLATATGMPLSTTDPLATTIYSLPSATVSSTFITPSLNAIALSASGSVLEESFTAGAPCSAQAITLPGGGTLWCATSMNGLGWGPLSPDGTLLATDVSTPGQTAPTSNIYLNGVLVTAVPGASVTWIDNNTLLTTSFVYDSVYGIFTYTGSNLFDSTGHLSSSPPVPQLQFGSVQPLSSNLLYGGGGNAIYSLTTGAAVWASGSPITGFAANPPAGGIPETTPWGWRAPSSAVSGAHVVFQYGHLILAEPR